MMNKLQFTGNKLPLNQTISYFIYIGNDKIKKKKLARLK